MKLHLDKNAFEAIILDIEKRENIRSDVLEKDYYVSLILNELSQKQNEVKAYFKGGTALYKALSSINRFSEDIDLTVYIEDCPSNTKKKVRLEKSAFGYTCLPIISNDKENQKNGRSATAIYGYETILKNFTEDPLQRFGRVKVEATSFTISEPTEKMLIAPVLYDKSTDQQKIILKNTFNVFPFSILTIQLERIFIDKVFAAEFYYRKFTDSSLDDVKRKGAGFDASKHIYDLMVLFKQNKIQKLLSDEKLLKQIISYKRKEELIRIGGIEPSLKICEFSYLSQILYNSEFAEIYEKMLNIYVFNDKDKLPLKNASDIIKALKTIAQ